MTSKTLPTIQQIFSDDLSIIKKKNQLSILLNSQPKKEWLQNHPMARNVKYLPIERVEYLLNVLFVSWRVEILESKIMANSVVVTVRLHVEAPDGSNGTYAMIQDGIGAAPIQTDKGAKANDFSAVKNDAVMKAAPAAESYAIKDAAEKFGRIFGKDLNRKTQSDYSILGDKYTPQGKSDSENIFDIMDLVELQQYFMENPHIKDDSVLISNLTKAKAARMSELKQLINSFTPEQMAQYWEQNPKLQKVKGVKELFAAKEIQNG